MSDHPLPEVGDRIRYQTRTARRGFLENIEREGTVTCIWGYDNEVMIRTEDEHGHCVPSLGDTWQKVEDQLSDHPTPQKENQNDDANRI